MSPRAPTQDALGAATRLLKRVAANGKALRVFLGFGRQRLLVVTDTRADLVQSLPIRELMVRPDTLQPATLAETFRTIWAELQAAPTTAIDSTPRATHGWRNTDFASRGKRR